MFHRQGKWVVVVCPMCRGRLVDDGEYRDCVRCDYQAPTGIHDLIPRTVRERESDEHRKLKKKACRWLELLRYETETEYGCELSRAVEVRKGRPQKYVIVDVVGIKKGKAVVAVECGWSKKGLLEILTRGFAEVWAWRHGARDPKRVAMTTRFPRLRFEYGIDVPNPALAEW